MTDDIKPIDLRQLYGEYFRIQLDEAAECESGGRNNPWYYQIPCKFGHIYPVSEKLLGFWCESGTIRRRLHREHPEINVTNWSDDGEAIFLFAPDQMDIIAEYAQPKKKRRLSDEHKKKLAKSGLQYRFKSQDDGSNGLQNGVRINENIGRCH